MRGKSNSIKKITCILLAVFLIVTAVGCTSQQGRLEEKPNNAPAAPAEQVSKDIILATTTSTQDSGLLDVLLPVFEQEYGFNVKTIAVGTGQALAMGERGDADVLLTHAPAAEIKLLEAGDIINYRMVMHNDFVVVGPAEDPAGIKGMATSAESFAAISQGQQLFISRGDDSGTHKKELAIWKKAGIENPAGNWYQETGSGMGQTITVASEKGGYTLTDRATFLALRDNLNLVLLIEGEPDLLNIYHVAQVNPEKSSLINAQGAKAFVEFMVSERAQQLIAEFGVDRFGAPLFFPDAHRDPAEYGLKY